MFVWFPGVTTHWVVSLTAQLRALASSFSRFFDHTRRATAGRTPLDEWSVRRRDLYLTTHNTHNRKKSMSPVEFEPTIAAGERPKTYALDRAATGTTSHWHYIGKFWKFSFIATASRNNSSTDKILYIPVREAQFHITTSLHMHVVNFKISRKRVMNFMRCYHHIKGNFSRFQFPITVVLKIQVFRYIMLWRWTKSSWNRWPRILKASPFIVTSAVHVMCTVKKVALVKVFLSLLRFPLSLTFHQCFIFIHQSDTRFNISNW